jgi:hypothetical protein
VTAGSTPARSAGVRPIASVDELRADVFESDQELEEFLAGPEEFRHEHMPVTFDS